MLKPTSLSKEAATLLAASCLCACSQSNRPSPPPYELLGEGFVYCSALEVDADGVYVTYDGWGAQDIHRIVPGVDGYEKVVDLGLNLHTHLASDEAYLYWATGSLGGLPEGIGRVRKDGTGGPETLVVDRDCNEITVSGDSVAYSCRGGEDVDGQYALEEYSLSVGSTERLLVEPEVVGIFYQGLQYVEEYLYVDFDDCVLEFRESAAEPRVVICASDWKPEWAHVIRQHIVSGDFVYMSTVLNDGSLETVILRAPLAGGEAELIAHSNKKLPDLVAVHEGFVYWFQGEGNSFSHDGDTDLARAAVAGGPVEILFGGLNEPSDLEVFDGWIYWCDLANGNVARVEVPEPSAGGG